MGKKEFVELLSPAGNKEAFYGALKAGADAVYLAGNQYGARAYADNFSQKDLVACLRYAHMLHKKIYLTVNTLVKEEELEELPAFLSPLVEEGLDGVIIQDFGVLQKIHEWYPQLPLHASTQMNITGAHGAKLLKRLGVVRVVPARELSLEEIRALIRESEMEVECFIHGAICYSYSGQCLFSSMLGGRSGNRGRCAQPCRLPYQILAEVEKKAKKQEQYPLSLRDLCTLELLPELVEAGIASFKIEGRMKKPEYAAGVTAVYRAFLDRYLEGSWEKPSSQDWDRLLSLYIRSEVGTGYYHCQNGKNMITLDSPAYRGADEQLLEDIRDKYLRSTLKLPVKMKGIFLIGKRAELWISKAGEERWTVVEGDFVEKASKSPVTQENLIAQLSKLGDSSFVLNEDEKGKMLELQTDENIFYPLKKLNELRRQAVRALEEELIHEK